jgi:hypothetical protein
MSELNIAELLKIRQIRENYTPPSDNIVFTIDGKNIGSLQNYVTFAGLPKTGKSTFISALISTIFFPGDLWSMKLNLPKDRNKVAYFDTESADVEFYNQSDRIKKFAGINGFQDRLFMYQVREDSPNVIRQMIQYLLSNNENISVVIIDGLLDLCINYNDERETRLLTNWLKKITKQFNILIICVIHLGKKDGETLGHLGSNSDRWSQSTLTIKKDKENKTFVLESKFLRSADDINPIIVQNINGFWHSTSGLNEDNNNTENALLNTILDKEKTYKELVDSIIKHSNRGINYAKNTIKKWINDGKIEKTDNGYIIKNYF